MVVSTPPPSTTQESHAARVEAILSRLDACLKGCAALLGTSSADKALSLRTAGASLLLRGKLRWELRAESPTPWLVMMAGGTNVGKSEIFNALAGMQGALPDARSAQTKHPLAWLHRDDVASLSAMLAPGWTPLLLENPGDLNASDGAGERRLYLLVHGDDARRGLCLFDAPDIDSDLAANREKAHELAAASDALLFVTVTEKYNDRLCVEFLRQAVAECRDIRVVYNLATADNREARDDLRARVLPRLLDNETAGVLGAAVPQLVEVPLARNSLTRHDELREHVAALATELRTAAMHRASAKRTLVARLSSLVLDATEALAARHEADHRYLAALDATLAELEVEAGRRLRAYHAAQPFRELDELLQTILTRLEVPYVDRALDLAGGLFRRVGMVAGISPAEEENRRRDREERQAAGDGEVALLDELVAAARAAVIAHAAAQPDHPMTAILREKLAEMEAKAPASEEPNNGRMRQRTSAEESEYLKVLEAELTQALRERPVLRQALVAARGVAMLAGGASALMVPGGFFVGALAVPFGAALGRLCAEFLGKQWLAHRHLGLVEVRAEASTRRLREQRANYLAAFAPPVPIPQVQQLRAAAINFETLRPTSSQG